MIVKRVIAGLVALPVAMAAFAAPSACTSFSGEEPDPDASAASEAGSDGSTTDATTPPDAGIETCRAPCGKECLVDPLDGPAPGPGWRQTVPAGNALTFVDGRLLATVPVTGSAYLAREISISPARPLHLSFSVRLDVSPADGTTLAKVVDSQGDEISVQVDGGSVRACIEVKTPPPLVGTACGAPKKLPLGTDARITLDFAPAPLFNVKNIVKLQVGCGEIVQHEFERTDLLPPNTASTLHFGLEGRGTATYDNLDVSPAD